MAWRDKSPCCKQQGIQDNERSESLSGEALRTLSAEGVLNPNNCQRSEAKNKVSLQQAAGNPQVEWEDEAVKELKKLDTRAQRAIVRFMRDKIATDDDPRRFGDPLRKDLKGFWKYRIGSYRVICSIEDGQIIVLVVRIGHRRNIYR